MGTPQIIHLVGFSFYKRSIWGCPHSRKPPYGGPYILWNPEWFSQGCCCLHHPHIADRIGCWSCLGAGFDQSTWEANCASPHVKYTGSEKKLDKNKHKWKTYFFSRIRCCPCRCRCGGRGRSCFCCFVCYCYYFCCLLLLFVVVCCCLLLVVVVCCLLFVVVCCLLLFVVCCLLLVVCCCCRCRCGRRGRCCYYCCCCSWCFCFCFVVLVVSGWCCCCCGGGGRRRHCFILCCVYVLGAVIQNKINIPLVNWSWKYRDLSPAPEKNTQFNWITLASCTLSIQTSWKSDSHETH